MPVLTTQERCRNQAFGTLMVFVCGLALGKHPELQTLFPAALFGIAGVLLIFED